MLRRILAVLSVLAVILLVSFTVVLKPGVRQASPKRLAVTSQTRGEELLTAEALDNHVRVTLKNNYRDTITAFAIKIGDTMIKEDFAYSEVNFGVEPDETLEQDYWCITPTKDSEIQTIHLLAVIRKDGTKDGNLKVAQEVIDERLGEKIQILRTLRILEGQSPADLKKMRPDIVTALNTSESETLVSLSELSPTSRSDNQLSDDLKAGLQWGREKMLQRFDVLEKLPTEERGQGFTELRDRSRKLFAKL
jgi:hypothetical protein